jgi:hypothetical protein
VGGDAGLVAGRGGEVGHVLVRRCGQGQLLLLLLNCRQILEHHLDRPQLATKIHQLAAEISTESSASRCKIDQISRPCGAMVHVHGLHAVVVLADLRQSVALAAPSCVVPLWGQQPAGSSLS